LSPRSLGRFEAENWSVTKHGVTQFDTLIEAKRDNLPVPATNQRFPTF